MKKTKLTKHTRWPIVIAGAIWVALAITAVFYALLNAFSGVNKHQLISPLVVEAKESVRISCDDVVGFIRCKYYKGEITEMEAKTLIAIAKPESMYNPRAKNRHSTASGIFQIIASTWYHHDCVGDKWNFKDNTECAIKILRTEGVNAWASSKSQWSKEISKIEI